MKRHFTATAFVVHEGRTLLHWHRKLQQWMPPGGHLLPDEDPVAGALREVREETGIEAELLALTPAFAFDEPAQLQAPFTVLIEDSAEAEEPHQHIDLIYFSRPRPGTSREPSAPDDTLVWVSEAQLLASEPLPLLGEDPRSVAEDVRLLALEAIRAEREHS
ncbi:MAG: NUDIX domain-containing protein [Dehalococcoidia bacterium]